MFVGMLLYMAVLKLPKQADYWRKNSIFHVAFPATVLPRDRFMAITQNLHISDPADDAKNDAKKGTAEYDALQKVKPLLDMIRTRCKSNYHPKQHISVDERMVATKARLSIKQYMKAKPTKWGIKFFVLADVNGYTVDYQMYTGKSKFTSGKGLSFDIVTSLVNKEYLGTGYNIYCDNFYTSPYLFRHLKQQGQGACGTYRQGRVGVPSTQTNALNKKSPRGSIRWIRDGDLLFVKWMDTREVSLCTTIHPAYSGETVLRWKKTDAGRERVPIPRPTAVGEYNRYMGGVDTSDQMLGTNTAHRKTKRWNTTVFQHLLDISVTNSYIIHKELCAEQGKKHMTRQNFQEKLVAQLIGVPLQRSTPTTQAHLPVPTNTDTTLGRKSDRKRLNCVLCYRKSKKKMCVSWKCEACDVGLCLRPERNCFKEYHT
ncbi:piggyBac transposable element-derived protein 4-like [Diretmus argenteus]